MKKESKADMMRDRIKVMGLITGLNTGGAEMMLYQTMTRLDRSIYEPVVVSLERGGKLADRLRENGIRVYELGFTKRPSGWPRLFQLLRILKREQPHVLHAYMFHADLIGRLFGRMAGVPVVISSIRNENIGGRLRERLLGMTKRYADRVTAVCQAAGERQVKSGAVSREQLTVIYNGVDLARFEAVQGESRCALRRELAIPENHFVFATVGRMERQKNHLRLLESLADLEPAKRRITLLLIGDGSLRPNIERKIAELGLEANVCLAGLRSDVPRLLRAADAFVLASLWEGFPNVVIEAMASALPVIATRSGGVGEILDPPHSGFIVEPDDRAEMTKAMSALAAMDGRIRERMGQYAKHAVSERFTLERTLEQTEQLYLSLLSTKGVGMPYERTQTG